ncbi:MAG: ATP synthase F0 subunit A [Acidobacteria bacterium]|nr:MAG: ATP synthase F0 subunit A [Acidobacteriota bacterium]
MPEQIWFTHILNALFAAPVDGLFHLLGIPVLYPAAPITNTFALEVLTALILVIIATLVRSRLSVERPGAIQQSVELSWNAIGDHGEEVIGHGGKRFLPFLFTLFFFILIGNLMGLVPSLDSPTAGIETTLGLALATFVYFHAVGLKKLGIVKYAKSFAGPMIFLAPLMVPLEIISSFARILSLSVRLFANMFAGEMITTIFLALLPIAGIAFMGLHVFIAILQAYIFMVLAMVYLSGATAEEH